MQPQTPSLPPPPGGGAPEDSGGTGPFVGPYRLERALGRGGMGLVFLAHRADQQYEKRVAIKLLSGASREQALTRFRAERQILAKLDHPNIARMLDGGVTPDGEPYFVMDYIPGGEAIDDYCDHHKLSVRSRIELFLSVCDAVHYAHRFLVVHRDLKPSNVQVSRDGVAKLVDFGIAKDLLAAIGDGPLGEATGDHHATGTVAGIAMTPAYASPEQVRGESIGTASDIYALGVLLYELVTGTAPYLTAATDVESLLREVTHGTVPPASQAYVRRNQQPAAAVLASRGLTKPKQLERLLDGDLDAIIQKAMAREAQNRYASADQLAEDLRRYLAGDMVRAAHHNTQYRVRKFVERYRAISSAVVVVVLGSLLLASVMSGIALKKYLDYLEARSAALEGEQVTRYLAGAFRQAPPGASTADVLRAGVSGLGPHRTGEAAWKERARLALAEAMVGAGAYEEAAHLLEQLVTQNQKTFSQANPERVQQMALLGEALLAQENARDAAAWFRRAIDARFELEVVPVEVPPHSVLEAKLNQALAKASR